MHSEHSTRSLLGVLFRVSINSDVEMHFEPQEFVAVLRPLKLDMVSGKGVLHLKGTRETNELLLQPSNCTSSSEDDCRAVQGDFYLKVTVLRSRLVASLVMIVGWSYFTAWSISFYPQIYLNYQRKSVVGLNFDFLLLNIIGFAAYSVYNLFVFFDSSVQKEYEVAHPHSPIPVLLNDVFFAVHALFACLLTVLQCLIYYRGSQRVSNTCYAISAFMILAGVGAGAVTFFGYLNMLQFVTSLSYIKMAVTLLKYIPQAVLNFRRKSTSGWSIGNVLLDFTGGCLDILQMCLQCWNVSDWSAFFGNPVKFGLGLISILFDILFIVQHYVLYRHASRTTRTESKSGGLEMEDGVTEKLSSSELRSTTRTDSATQRSNER